MKKRFLFITAVLLLTSCIFVLSSCEEATIPTTTPKENDHVHEYDEWSIKKAPTCEETGINIRSCSCGNEETNEIPALGHSIPEQWEQVTIASCTADGISQRKCSNEGCDYSEKNVTPATGHSLGDWTITLMPTNTTNGERVIKCKNCQEVSETEILYAGSYGLKYEIKGEKAIVTGLGEFKGSELVIPKFYKGYPVTEIGNEALNWNSIVSVTLPDTITKIGENAFSGGAKNVYVSSLENWLNIEFENQYSNPVYCKGKLYVGDELVTNVVIPENITTIGDYAFYYYNTLESVTLHSGIEKIGQYAFFMCTSLKEINIDDLSDWFNIEFEKDSSPMIHSRGGLKVDGEEITNFIIPDGVTTITQNHFSGSATIKSISIPASVKKIDAYAFNSCDVLEALYITDIAAWCSIEFEDGWSYDIEQIDLYINGEKTPYVVIPEGVEEISAHAFECLYKIESIKLPSTIKKIGTDAFYRCVKIDAVYINSLDYWWNVEFENNLANPLNEGAKLYVGGVRLKNLIIPESVTEIKPFAFYGCQRLRKVTVHNKLTKIGKEAFYATFDLEGVYINDLAAWCNISFADEFANPLYFADNLYLKGTLVKNLVIPNSVTEIGQYAFAGAEGIKSVTFHNNIKSVGEGAFYRYISSEDPQYIELSLENLASWSEIEFGDSEANPLIYTNGLYLDGKLVKDLVIPEGVTSIGSFAFSYCPGVETVTIPSSVKNIGESAFADISVVYINDLAAWSGVNIECGEWSGGWTKEIYLNGEPLVNVVIPEGVTEIGSSVFAGCDSIKTVVLPSSVKSIGKYAFYHCTNLESINLPEGIPAIKRNTFQGCKYLKNIELPSTITSIEKRAFTQCKSLVEIKIPKNVKTIGENAFSECEALKTVELEEGLIEIGSGAFYVCYALENMELPSTVKFIGRSAFAECSRLTLDKIPESLERVDLYAFSGCFHIINKEQSLAYFGNWLISVNKNNTGTAIIKEGVTEILSGTFYNADFSAIQIPKSLKTIERYAFRYTTNLKTIIYTGTMEEWNNIVKDEDWFNGDSLTEENLRIKCSDGVLKLK